MVYNREAYYLGSIAPDTIGSKPNCCRNDKKFVHLRSDIADAEWLGEHKMAIFNGRVDQFAAMHICNGSRNDSQTDFNIGYLVHLLTDKWNHQTIRQKLLKIAKENGIQESDKAFFDMCVNDLEALDAYLLAEDPGLNRLFAQLREEPVQYCLSGYIEKEYIEKSMAWWEAEYLPRIRCRELKYITERDIDDFIKIACENMIPELQRYRIIKIL